MKKILLLLTAMLATMATEAKIVKIAMSDGEWKIYSSSQLSEITFDDYGIASVVGYDGEVLATLDPSIDKITIGDDEEIISVTENTLSFDLAAVADHFEEGSDSPADVPMYDRDVVQISFAYPSTDPYGDPITLSGMMTIPKAVFNKRRICEGILLLNHFSYTSLDWSPSTGFMFIEPIFLCNPYTPNFILVEADLYSFGVSGRFPQAFIQGHANEHASLDALLAARRILKSMKIYDGNLTFNIGYSSGGFEALSTQRCRDMEYADKISFTKTYAGGSPSDMKECYRQLVERDTVGISSLFAMILAATNETQHLNIDYTDFFVPEVAEKIESVILSKKYNLLSIEPMLGASRIIHETLTAPYCDLNSEESLKLQDVLETLNLNRDWTPDRSQKILIMNVEDDDIVPISAAKAMADYLKANGMRTSIIPGLGNLETDFSMSGVAHMEGSLPFFIDVISEITTWSIMYTDGVLNPEWQKLLEDNLKEAVDLTDQTVLEGNDQLNYYMLAPKTRQLTPSEKRKEELYQWLNINH